MHSAICSEWACDNFLHWNRTMIKLNTHSFCPHQCSCLMQCVFTDIPHRGPSRVDHHQYCSQLNCDLIVASFRCNFLEWDNQCIDAGVVTAIITHRKTRGEILYPKPKGNIIMIMWISCAYCIKLWTWTPLMTLFSQLYKIELTGNSLLQTPKAMPDIRSCTVGIQLDQMKISWTEKSLANR